MLFPRMRRSASGLSGGRRRSGHTRSLAVSSTASATPRSFQAASKRTTHSSHSTSLLPSRRRSSRCTFSRSTSMSRDKHGCPGSANIVSSRSSLNGILPSTAVKKFPLTLVQCQAKVDLGTSQAPLRDTPADIRLPSALLHAHEAGAVGDGSCRVRSHHRR